MMIGKVSEQYFSSMDTYSERWMIESADISHFNDTSHQKMNEYSTNSHDGFCWKTVNVTVFERLWKVTRQSIRTVYIVYKVNFILVLNNYFYEGKQAPIFFC